MKAFKHIAAALAALLLLTSCSVLGGMSSNTGTSAGTTSTGSSTGSALTAIFNVLKNTGTLDLGNLTNLINLGQILMGANSLTNATQAYTEQFSKDLISSSKLINSSNVNNVIASLKKLASTDNSALNKATTAAFAGNLTPVSTQNKDVKASVDAITAVVNAMK